MASWCNKEDVPSNNSGEEHDPNLLVCPITFEPIVDGVVDPEGFAYEREAIMSWVTRHQTSPMTRSPLSPTQLSPLDLHSASSSPSKYSVRGANTMQLFLRTLSNKTRIMYVPITATVLELKKAVRHVDGIPVDQQRLLCSGKQLVDGLRLSDYKIREQSTIYLLLRLRGGAASVR